MVERAEVPLAMAVEAFTIESAAVPDPDVDLVARHRAGDARAFDEVYVRYSGMVYGLALRLSANPQEAEDLTQDVFLRIYRHLAGFRGGSSLKTWVYRVALNQCRSRFARFRPPTQGLFEEGVEEAPQLRDPSRGPEEIALSTDTARRISEALARLPLVFREAVVLRDLEGLAYEEIADATGVRVGTVRSRIARGREQLRQLLGSAA
jgi:RNA polymerase sigma-70 factor (ECF subfamily)